MKHFPNDSSTWQSRHRGPYTLCVTRPSKKTGHFVTEWLPGLVEVDDVEAEASVLLEDPRDTIIAVDVWSTREQQFVMTFREAA